MTRREWKAAVAAIVLWTGTAVADAPAFLPGSAANTTNVVTIRTAGQPERKLQVLKTERLPDGKYLTEVKDLGTGAIFTIADTKPLGTAEASKPLPVVSPATPPATLPGTTVAAPSNLPQAKPRNVDPLLANTPATMASTTRPRSGYENTTPAPQPEYPTLMGKLRKANTVPTAPAPVSPTAPTKQSPISTALFGAHGTPPQPQPTLVGRFSEPSNAKPATTTASATPQPMPTLMGKLFGDKPAAAAHPVTAAKPPATFIRPNAVPTAEPVRTAVAPPALVPPPAMEPVVMMTMPKPAPTIEQASLAPEKDPSEPNFNVVPVKAMTMQQIGELVKDLRMHHKPSQRVEAAQSLAKSPMAGMVEVRQVLAEASYRDPEPVVRAHCIDILTKMQYDEPNYRKYVESLVSDDEPALRRAATAAMKQ